jgi:hypothetical protein
MIFEPKGGVFWDGSMNRGVSLPSASLQGATFVELTTVDTVSGHRVCCGTPGWKNSCFSVLWTDLFSMDEKYPIL